jgi:hypothetical protein
MAKVHAVGPVSEQVGRGLPGAAPEGEAAAPLQKGLRDQSYRPALVERLERAVREGRYDPDPRAIADAIVRRIDALLDS